MAPLPRRRRDSGSSLVIEVSPVPAAIARTRDEVARALVNWGLSDLCDDAVLCLSVAVTNSVLRVPPDGTVAVTIHRAARRVRVEVTEQFAPRRNPQPARPAGRGPPQETRPGEPGWGLQIIDAVAASWGTDAEAGRWRLWFELDIPPMGRTGTMP